MTNKILSDFALRQRRPKINCSLPIKTDQSQTPMTDINRIMEHYLRTGMLPQHSDRPMAFVNDMNTPTFEAAHDVINHARMEFAKLPKSLRNELDNDYRKFESWLTHPENRDRAIKLGLLSAPKTTSPPKSTNTTKPVETPTIPLPIEDPQKTSPQ